MSFVSKLTRGISEHLKVAHQKRFGKERLYSNLSMCPLLTQGFIHE